MAHVVLVRTCVWWYPYRSSNSAVKTLYGYDIELLVMNEMKIKRMYRDYVGYDQPVLLSLHQIVVILLLHVSRRKDQSTIDISLHREYVVRFYFTPWQ